MAEDFISSLTPSPPPATEEERLAWLRLIRSRRVGVATFHRLLGEYRTATAALKALPEIARASGVARYEAFSEQLALQEIRTGGETGAAMLCLGDPDYPEALSVLPDAPPVLWAIGQTDTLCRPMVALVGARNASSLGLRMAKKLAGELAEAGINVVSGLARGIDAAAHTAAVNVGQRGGATTVGIHAGGVDVIYPAENADLAATIGAHGCRISEQPMGLEPLARHFPQRNRLVSGLAHAIIVVEAAERSGSLITANCATEQGREVLAVPGHPFDARAGGCNALIRQGATLVRSVTDVMEALAPLLQPVSLPAPARRAAPIGRQAQVAPVAVAPAPVAQGDLRAQILDRLGPSPVAEDQLIRDLALPAARLAPELLELELEGQIVRHAGGLLALAQPA